MRTLVVLVIDADDLVRGGRDGRGQVRVNEPDPVGRPRLAEVG
jgi:hypothetical protein